MSFNGGSLDGADPDDLFFFLFAFGILLDDIHFPEGHFFRMEVEILLVIVDGVEELLFSDHAIEFGFGITEQLHRQ